MNKPKSIGENWSFKHKFEPDDRMFEYYMRRGNKIYFRNHKSKIVIDWPGFAESFLSENPKYGQEFEIDFQ